MCDQGPDHLVLWWITYQNFRFFFEILEGNQNIRKFKKISRVSKCQKIALQTLESNLDCPKYQNLRTFVDSTKSENSHEEIRFEKFWNFRTRFWLGYFSDILVRHRLERPIFLWQKVFESNEFWARSKLVKQVSYLDYRYNDLDLCQ